MGASSSTLTSEAQFANDASEQPKPVKLVDKSRRAFSISIDSSKAFELAIRKPRRKAKHHWNKLRTCVYGTYLLFTKHHGSPPATKDLNSFFILYACILAIDILSSSFRYCRCCSLAILPLFFEYLGLRRNYLITAPTADRANLKTSITQSYKM